MYCYSCGDRVPADLTDCPRCGSLLVLTEQRRRVGAAYLLNALPSLVAAGTIDAATAMRIEAAARGGLRRDPSAAPAVGANDRQASRAAATPPPSARHVTPGDLADERAPSLLLYVGAFLIVVSALIFVDVSGSQIPDVLKLGLMVGGTAAFVAAGIVCHRYVSVRQAGRTFLAIGALLVPIDVAATYALFLRTSPFSSPLLWLWGSVLAAVLYAVVALRGYGSWYARSFFLATLSALGAALRLAEVGAAWWEPAFLAIAIPHLAASRWIRGRSRPLCAPLLTPSLILVAIALTVTALMVLTTLAFGGTDDRVPVAVSVALATAYYAVLFDRPLSRTMALITAGLVPIALLYAGHQPARAYGIALFALAVAYAAPPAILARVRPFAVLPPETGGDARRLVNLWVPLSLLAALGARDPGLLSLFATAYATIAAVTAVATGRERCLWAAGAFAGVAGLAALESARVTAEYRPIAIALAALLLYAGALRLRGPEPGRHARALREVAMGGAVLAAATGFYLSAARAPFRPSGTVLWQVTTWCVLVVAALLAAESRVRRAYAILVAASATALLAVLMEVACLDPRDAQWYATPVGAYLVALALLTLRYGPPGWAAAVPPVEATGAVVLLAPTYSASWGHDGLANGLRLVAESVPLLILGAVLRRRTLAAAAVSFLVLAGMRAVVDLLDRLPNWIAFATAGLLLLAVGFVLLLKRDVWLRAQTRLVRWWQGWEGPQEI